MMNLLMIAHFIIKLFILVQVSDLDAYSSAKHTYMRPWRQLKALIFISDALSRSTTNKQTYVKRVRTGYSLQDVQQVLVRCKSRIHRSASLREPDRDSAPDQRQRGCVSAYGTTLRQVYWAVPKTRGLGSSYLGIILV